VVSFSLSKGGARALWGKARALFGGAKGKNTTPVGNVGVLIGHEAGCWERKPRESPGENNPFGGVWIWKPFGLEIFNRGFKAKGFPFPKRGGKSPRDSFKGKHGQNFPGFKGEYKRGFPFSFPGGSPIGVKVWGIGVFNGGNFVIRGCGVFFPNHGGFSAGPFFFPNFLGGTRVVGPPGFLKGPH